MACQPVAAHRRARPSSRRSRARRPAPAAAGRFSTPSPPRRRCWPRAQPAAARGRGLHPDRSRAPARITEATSLSRDAAMRATAVPSLWPKMAILRSSTSLRSRQEPPHRQHVLRVVCQGGRLGAAAALSDTTLVVPDDSEPGVGEHAGHLAEDGDACDCLVAVRRARSRDHDDGRVPALCVRISRGLAQRADQVEAIRRDSDGFVARARDVLPPRGNR